MKAVGKALIFSALAGMSMASQAYTVTDTYIGGDDHGHGDVIGDPNYFDIFGADVSFNGSMVTIDIFTNFTSSPAVGSFSGLTNSGLDDQGIGLGDLFLSNSYTPDTSNGTLNDNATTGNVWTYGLTVDDRYLTSSTGGTSQLYALDAGDNDANAYLSDDYLSAGTFRNNQEVAVDVDSLTNNLPVSSGTWLADDTNGKITFSFDAAGTNLFDSGDLAFHWAMLCGNDVIEGVVSTPTQVSEPSVIALFGLGLFGLGLARRRA